MHKQACLSFLLLFSLSFSHTLTAQPEVTAANGLYFVKLSDGFNAILMPDAKAPNTELIFYVQSGSMYETDSLSGVSAILVNLFNKRFTNAINNGKSHLNPQNTSFTGQSTTERSIFKFVTTAENINACIALVRDSMFLAKFSINEINDARNQALQQIEDARHNINDIFNDKMLKGLYVQDHQKLEVRGNPGLIKQFEKSNIEDYFKKYFVPNNAYASITGNFSGIVVEDDFEKGFKGVTKSEFNPETVTKIVDLRPMTYNTQFIIEDTTSNPEFEICWQFPGTNSNFHESYPAFIIYTILKDKNNYIQAKAAKMGCHKFDVEYEANNFSGVLRIKLQPSKKNFYATYQFVMNELGRIDKMLLNESMIAAGKYEFKTEYNKIKTSKEYPGAIIKHWTYNDESYFNDLCDSVMSVSPHRLEQFVINYFNQSPHITGLRISKADRQALNIDSVFTDLDQNVGKYVFTYLPNVTTIGGGENKMKLQNLLLWLNLNPDVNAQINGFSDEHEYYKTTDADSIMQFMDSMPTFHLVNSNLMRKPFIRPEMARALKIIRFLYQNGISAERLCGTSMMFKSESKKEELDNLKCTVTLQKERKSPSLYEYHYGKKKPE